MRYARIWADDKGDSHIESLSPAYRDVENYAVGVPTMGMTEPVPAGVTHLLRALPGWVGDWHPTPVRQFFVVLQGRVGCRLGDDTETQLGPGDCGLLEDLTGKGHLSWVVGDEDLVMCMVTLPQGT